MHLIASIGIIMMMVSLWPLDHGKYSLAMSLWVGGIGLALTVIGITLALLFGEKDRKKNPKNPMRVK